MLRIPCSSYQRPPMSQRTMTLGNKSPVYAKGLFSAAVFLFVGQRVDGLDVRPLSTFGDHEIDCAQRVRSLPPTAQRQARFPGDPIEYFYVSTQRYSTGSGASIAPHPSRYPHARNRPEARGSRPVPRSTWAQREHPLAPGMHELDLQLLAQSLG